MAEETILRAACVQMRSGRDVAANLAQAAALTREAAAAGARYVLTPENTAIMDEDKDRVRGLVGTMAQDASVRAFSALAGELGIFLHVGSLALRPDDGKEEGKLVNRSVLFAPDGRIVAWYDKIHLFDVTLGGGEKDYRESARIAPGGRAVVASAAGARVGFSICYDLRFPALYRALALAGAQILAVPAAFTVPTGRAHWHVLTRARAIENEAFVMAAAQGGRHEGGRATFGHSLIVSPWGEVLAEAGEEPGVIAAGLDMEQVRDMRRRIPVLENERDFAPPGGEARGA